jgi:nitrate/nitrite-specific signal transduction histidine kinase
MRNKSSAWLWMGLALVVAGSTSALSAESAAPAGAVASAGQLRSATSEVFVDQARGRVSVRDKSGALVGVKPTPESAATGNSIPSQTAPATCDQQNASSPACYTATQQARPATR